MACILVVVLILSSCGFRGGELILPDDILLDAMDTMLGERVKGETVLHRAAIQGDVELLRRMLNGRRAIPYTEALLSDNTALQLGLFFSPPESRYETVSLLIQLGADVNAKASGKPHPLYLAAMRGFEEELDLLMESGAAFDSTGRDAVSPYIAMMRDNYPHPRAYFLLRKAGADPHQFSILGHDWFTPLEYAVAKGKLFAVEPLLLVGGAIDMGALRKLADEAKARELSQADWDRHGANPKTRTDEGFTWLHAAALACEPELVDLLLEHGAAVDSSLDIGKAIFSPLDAAAPNWRFEAGGTEGRNCSAAATTRMQDSMFENMLKTGKHDMGSLYSAIWHGYFQAVSLFVAAGGDLERGRWHGRHASRYRYTLLENAAVEGDFDLAKVLLASGASVAGSSLEIASFKGDLPLVRELLRFAEAAGTDISPLLQDALAAAAFRGQLPVVRELLGSGADPNQYSKDEYTPLALAAVTRDSSSETPYYARSLVESPGYPPYGSKIYRASKRILHPPKHMRVIEELLAAGADANPDASPIHMRPIYLAAYLGTSKIVAALLEAGVRAEDGLYGAIEGDNPEVVRQLLSAGADANAVPLKDGRPPLHVVAIAKSKGGEGMKMLEVLLEYGTDPCRRDKWGRTALDALRPWDRDREEAEKKLRVAAGGSCG